MATKESAATTTQNPTTSDAAAPAKPKRTRGPNKGKKIEASIAVRTEAHIPQAEMVKLLSAYAGKMLDAETAAGMELQVQVVTPGPDKGMHWQSANEHDTPKVRFATKGMR